jgi:hypothetical protein
MNKTEEQKILLEQFKQNYIFENSIQEENFEKYFLELTSKYKFVLISGKPVFVKEKKGISGIVEYDYSTIEDIKNFFKHYNFNIIVNKGKEKEVKKLNFINELISSPFLKRFENIVFDTTKGREYVNYNNENTFNLWTGFVEPKKGSVKPFFRLLKDVLMATKEERKHIIKLMGYSVKFPNEKIENAIVMKGIQGTGKTSISMTFKAICPNHSVEIKDIEELKGFNANIVNIKYFLFEEAVWGGKKTLEGWLKTFLSSNEIRIEPKGVNAFTIKNVSFSLFTSNEKWAVPIGQGDRRYNVFETSDKLKNNREYFKKYYDWLFNEGKHHLVYFFQNMNYDNFDVRKVLESKVKTEMAYYNYSSVEKFLIALYNKEMTNLNNYEKAKGGVPYFVFTRNQLFDNFKEEMNDKFVDKRQFSRELNSILKFDEMNKNWKDNWVDGKERAYYLPQLFEGRKKIAEHLHLDVDVIFD